MPYARAVQSSLSFASSLAAVARGARNLFVIAPAKTLTKKRLPKLLDRKRTELLLELAKDTKPGARGAVATTLASTPRWLTLGVLPDTLSRHNSPSRADCIRHVVSRAKLGGSGKTGIVLVLDDPAHALAACNAVARALPGFSRKAAPGKLRVQVAAITAEGEPVPIDEVVQTTVEHSRLAASLVDSPPTELDPEGLAKAAREMLKIPGVRVREIVGDKLLAAGLRGIHAVGRAAVSAPRMLVATREGDDDRGLHVALVGKGITFDTGGLHLKPRGGMEGMKADMGGAAAVLGAFATLARTGCPHRVTLLLCMAENANDARSYKPDDILTLHSGKTVEINNTDAEGRLLLGDGVSYAARELQADVVIDAATLTGAQLVSTGLVHAAVVSDDEALERLVVQVGRETGDLAHPLPFAPELFASEFDSPVADMRNSVANRSNAQSSCAAQFVYTHLSDAPGATRRRWCHVDLAGPAFPKDRATGYGVALLSELVRRL
jgi:probable aminopeptidase NPEPL1